MHVNSVFISTTRNVCSIDSSTLQMKKEAQKGVVTCLGPPQSLGL